MPIVDVKRLDPGTRLAAAEKIRALPDFDLPELTHFNSSPCPDHVGMDRAQIIPPCRRCGITFRQHQRVGIAWLYMRGKGLIADQVGLGKTAQAAGLIATIKQAGELDGGKRVVVICRPAAIDQWVTELRRFLPGMSIESATGPRAKRIDRYLGDWEILVSGYQMFCRDAELFNNFDPLLVVSDDVDAVRNPATDTAYEVKRFARRCERVVVLNGTPLQKRLTELHSILELVGGLEVFGPKSRFRRRYVREESVSVYNKRIGRDVTTRKTVGYQNLDEFKALAAPMTLRRTPADIQDVDLPVISPHTVFLELHPKQREAYTELRKGVLKVIKAEGAAVKHTKAATAFTYGAQICSGLATIGYDDISSKLDWVCNTLTGDLDGEKVVVFCQFTRNVAALSQRLHRLGLGHEIIWGRDPDRKRRAASVRRFWDEPGCRVLIGTSAIEQSLNLQVSRHLINVDQILNPARMQQLAGRVRRDGSSYKTVYVHNLLTHDTQEEGYLDVLRMEQALADHIYDEANQLYEPLNPLMLLQLIGRSR